jgi:phage baseplate assembly protein W
MAEIPHIALPFRFVGTSVAVVEQDTEDEVLQCVETICRYVPGMRSEYPEFGIPDQAFRDEPDTDEVREAIEEYEPRASVVLDSELLLDELAARINVSVEVL